jgi:DNA-binding transcriptional MerR regulator
VKTNKALRTIGEAAESLNVATHVIRFWESSFSKLKPVKYNGRRYYTNENIELLRRIKTLLHEHNFSIKEADIHLKKPKNPLVTTREKLMIARDRLNKLIPSSIYQDHTLLS